MQWIFSVLMGAVSICLSVKISKAVTIAISRREITRAVDRFNREFPDIRVVDDKQKQDDLPKFGDF